MNGFVRRAALRNRENLGAAFQVVSIRAFSALIGLAIGAILARFMGPSNYGHYVLLTSLLAIITVPISGGLRQTVLRETAQLHSRGDIDGTSRLVRWAGATGIAFAVVAFGAFWCWISLQRTGSASSILIAAGVSVFLSPLIAIGGGLLNGVSRYSIGQIAEYTVRPVAIIIIISATIIMTRYNPLTTDHALGAYAAATVIAGALAMLLALTTVRHLRSVTVRNDPSANGHRSSGLSLLSSTLSFSAISGLQLISDNADALIIGTIGDHESLGKYRTATALASIISFGLLAVNTVIAPQIAALGARRDYASMKALVQSVTTINVAIGLTGFIIIALFGKTLLYYVFGQQYEDAFIPLLVLSFGQLANTMFGPVATLLNYTGKEKVTLLFVGASALLNVLLNLLLIEPFGILGAAMSSSAALFLWNFSLWIFIRMTVFSNRKQPTAAASVVWRASDVSTRRPNFFILGAPKCGTTTLAHWLAQHPAVYMSPQKEPHYFNVDMAHRLHTSEVEYEALFARANPDQTAVGESSVWYLYSKEAVLQIESYSPGARYIVCLRNPTDMARSLHGQQVFSGNEDLVSFEAAWAAAEDRRAGLRVPRHALDPSTLIYPDACAVGTQLARLLDVVDRDRVLVVLLDDLAQRPAEVLLRVQAFLGIPIQEGSSLSIENGPKVRRSRLGHTLVDSIGRLKIVLGIGMSFGVLTYLDRLNRKPAGIEPLRPNFRQSLVEYFEPEVDILERLLGRNLAAWRR